MCHRSAKLPARQKTDPSEKRKAFEDLKQRLGRGRITATPRKGFTKAERAQIYADYEGRCRACDRLVGKRFDCDHRVQLWRGGKHVRANWELLCVPCHAEKTGGEATGNAKCRRIEKREIEGPAPSTLKSRNEFPPGRPLTDPKRKRNFRGQVVERPA